MSLLQWFFLIPGVLLLALAIHSMLPGAYRRFPFLFAYLVGTLLATSVEFAAASGLDNEKIYARYYFANDLALQALVLLNVLHLIAKARAKDATVMVGPKMILAMAAVAVVIALFLAHDPNFNRWMTKFSRNIYFSAAVLNMWLWFGLIRARLRDPAVLAVSAGFGIQMTGAAIGHSLREISRSTILAGNLVIVLASFCALFVWWRIFRRWKPEPTDTPDKVIR